MDSGSDNESANGDGPKRKRRVRRLLPQPPGPDDGEKRTKPKLRKLRFAFVILGLAALAFVSWIFGIMMAVAQDLPSLENREQYKPAENSVVYDSYGSKLATLTNNQGRILLSSDEISPVMKEAVIAIEDRRFYEHDGVDFQGIARAVWQDVTSGSAQQGASTITQQFVKNALAAQDSRTVFQKLREAALAYHLERQWSKDKILTEYLNEIYFGEGATGIEAAAQHLLRLQPPRLRRGRDGRLVRSQLLPWEAAMLAGIISSPSAYSPGNFPENATARRNQVLANMRDEGYITDEEYTAYSARADPDPEADHAAGRELRRPLLHLLAAPAAGRPLRGRRGVRRRPADQVDARPRIPKPRPGDHPVDARRRSRRPPRPWCSTTRPAACWRWSAAPTTRHSRSTSPPTATASRAPRSSRSRW